MKAERYISVLGWMMDDLGLSGNEVIIYAMIYGFSQQGKGGYIGSLRDLPKWTGIPERSAIRILQRLVAKGLVVKSDWVDDKNQKRCMYQAACTDEGCCQNGGAAKMATGCCQNGGGGAAKMATPPYIKDNNKDIYKSNQSTACARTREELVADAKREFRERAEAEGGATYTKEMMDAFCDYWTEPYTNPVGRKLLRWQGEKTWDMAARLRTWASRDKQFAARARPAFERPKLRPAIDLTFDYAENQRKICELGGIHDGEDNGYDH